MRGYEFGDEIKNDVNYIECVDKGVNGWNYCCKFFVESEVEVRRINYRDEEK